MKKSEIEPLSVLEMGFLVRELLGPREAMSAYALALEKRLAAYEKEQERLRDMIGSLCRTLAPLVPEVTFADRSGGFGGMLDVGRIRMSYYRRARREPIPQKARPLIYDADADIAVAYRTLPEVNLAVDVEISMYLLADEGEERFIAECVDRAKQLLHRAQKTERQGAA